MQEVPFSFSVSSFSQFKPSTFWKTLYNDILPSLCLSSIKSFFLCLSPCLSVHLTVSLSLSDTQILSLFLSLSLCSLSASNYAITGGGSVAKINRFVGFSGRLIFSKPSFRFGRSIRWSQFLLFDQLWALIGTTCHCHWYQAVIIVQLSTGLNLASKY